MKERARVKGQPLLRMRRDSLSCRAFNYSSFLIRYCPSLPIGEDLKGSEGGPLGMIFIHLKKDNYRQVVHTFNASTLKGGASRSVYLRPAWSPQWALGQPGLLREILSQTMAIFSLIQMTSLSESHTGHLAFHRLIPSRIAWTAILGFLPQINFGTKFLRKNAPCLQISVTLLFNLVIQPSVLGQHQ